MALDPRPVEVLPSDVWIKTASADNAVATATKSVVTGSSHYVTAVSASYSATKSGLLQIKDDTTVIFELEVYDSAVVTFPTPLKITSGKAVNAVLAASGTSSTLGKVNLSGFTKEG